MNPPQGTGTVQFDDTSYLDSSPRGDPTPKPEIKYCSDDMKISSTVMGLREDTADQKSGLASERSAKSSVYTPSRNALMKAGWFGILDNTVSSANDVAAENNTGSRPKPVLEVQVEVEEEEEETRFYPRADLPVERRPPRFSLPKGRSDQLFSIVPSQPMSPLESPMRLIQHPKPTWNVDSSTQTGSSLKLNGRKPRSKVVKGCKCCVVT